MKRIFIFLFIISTISGFSQTEQEVESIAFGGYLSPLVKVIKDEKSYYYHPDGKHWIDEVKGRTADLFVVVKDGYYGVVNESGKLIIPFEYDDIKIETKYEVKEYIYKYIILRKDGKTGAADANGNLFVPVDYQDVRMINKNAVGIKENNLWGWVSAKNGAALNPPQYESIRSFLSDDYVEIRKGQKIGLANVNGTVIIPEEYDSYIYTIQTPDNLYFRGKKDKEINLFDEKGTLVFADFEDFYSLGDSEMLAYESNGLYGFANPESKTKITEAIYEKIERFVRGLSIVKKDNQYGVMNQKGKFIVELKYEEIQFLNADGNIRYTSVPTIAASPTLQEEEKMSEESRRIEAYEAEVEKFPYYILLKKENTFGVIDWNGKTIIEGGKYQQIRPHFYDGKTYYIVNADGKTGIVAPDGKILLPVEYQYNTTYQFSNQAVDTQFEVYNRFIPFAVEGDNNKYVKKIGLFDLKQKKILLGPKEQAIAILNTRFIKIKQQNEGNSDEILLYDIEENRFQKLPENVFNIGLMRQNLLLAELDNRLFQLIDRKGNVVYENPKWSSKGSYNLIRFPDYRKYQRGEFYHGLKKIYSDEGNLFIDKLGREKRFEDVEQVDDFYEGFAVAAKKVADKESYSGFKYKRGLIDTEGKVIIPFEYDEVYASGKNSEILMFSKENARTMIRRDGTLILGSGYDYIESGSSYDNIIVTKNGKYGLVDFSGNILIQPLYDELRRNHDGKDKTFPLMVKQNDWYYLVNLQGKKYGIKARKKHY